MSEKLVVCENMKLSELKEALRIRGMDDSGDKPTLLVRLKKIMEEEIAEEQIDLECTQESLIQDNLEDQQEENIPEVYQYLPQQTTLTNPVVNVEMVQIMEFMKLIAENLKMDIQTNSEKLKTDIQTKIQDSVENLDRKLEQISAKFNKQFETHQTKLTEMETRVDVTETKIRELEGNLGEKTESLHNQIDLQATNFTKELKRIDNKHSENEMKLSGRITDLEQTVQKGIQLNLNIAEEENKKTEARLRKEFQEKLLANQLNGKQNTIEHFKEELEKILQNMDQSIQNFAENRMVGNTGITYITCPNNSDDSTKFCGDFKKIHPINFIKTIKNKA